MNVVERAPAQGTSLPAEPPPPVAEAPPPAAVPSRGLKLTPLLSLIPYVGRYRARALAALAALLVAALATLAVPLAVRRMIDFGFSREGMNLIDSYFAVMIAVAGVLAVASAVRYYLVITLGERIVADLRSNVFNHLTSLSVSYFDQTKTGEILSRLTADTTQIKSAVGSSVSIALRNIVLFVGATTMMVITSPRLSLFVLIAIPVIVLPLYGFGRAIRRRGRAAQDTLADASAYAGELLGGVRTLQAFTNEKLARSRFARGGRTRLRGRQERDRRPRGADRDRDLPGVRQRRPGAVGRRAGRHRRRHHARTAVAVRPLCGVRGKRPRPALRSVGRAFAGVGRRRAAVRDHEREAGRSSRRSGRSRCRSPRAARSPSTA